MYKCFFKRAIDLILSGLAIVILALPMLFVAIAIKIDDPGPVLFKQKRVGKKKNGEITYFMIWKFRSMKMSTPHDTPTHLLENPDQYITRVGRFIRKASIDELPQIYQVFTSKLSVIGPRPALWSQEDLIAEREKYGANDIKPGITGWAQINGRDELEIDVKARFDGEYAAALNAGKFKGVAMDIKCFFGTVKSVLKSDGVVEGGTGEMKKQEEQKALEEAAKEEEAAK
ncbi:MAG: sugar transferase [Clostridia bacterium]|nr:sugar transferase [Clostridia bacterium]